MPICTLVHFIQVTILSHHWVNGCSLIYMCVVHISLRADESRLGQELKIFFCVEMFEEHSCYIVTQGIYFYCASYQQLWLPDYLRTYKP